jgi:type VI secretion system protein ImpE
MNAEELHAAGRLAEAIQAQTQLVRTRPTDADARFLLLALLCAAGDLERATRQLDALGANDPATQAGGRIVTQLLAAETRRREVLAGRGLPLLPPDPPADVAHRAQALAAAAQGDAAAAAAALDAAADASPLVAGKLDGHPFDAIRDTDDLLASVVEVFAGGRYLWLPFADLRWLEVKPPKTLLDLVWVPAELEDRRGSQAHVHLPVLYAGSHEHPDEAIRLGRRTEWADSPTGARGAGQRVLLTVSGEAERETALLSLRRLDFEAR